MTAGPNTLYLCQYRHILYLTSALAEGSDYRGGHRGIKKLWDVGKDYGGSHRWQALGSTEVDMREKMRGTAGDGW